MITTKWLSFVVFGEGLRFSMAKSSNALLAGKSLRNRVGILFALVHKQVGQSFLVVYTSGAMYGQYTSR